MGAFASLIVLLFVISFDSGIVDMIKVNVGIVLIYNPDSIVYSSPEGSKSSLGLILSIKGEQSGITEGTMIEASLILSPEHSSKGPFHGSGLNQELLMRRELESFGLIRHRCLTNKIVNKM